MTIIRTPGDPTIIVALLNQPFKPTKYEHTVWY